MRRRLTERLSVPGLRWGRLSLGSIICLAVLAIIALAAILAPLISPYDPLASGSLADPGGPLATAAERHGVSTGAVALAWLLHRSPVVLPIPGTGKVAHLEENMAAAGLELTQEELEAISAAV